MAMESEGQSPEQDSDYDGAWKEALRHHLPEFLAVYFPAMHAAIDWTTPVKWYDKELSQILGTAGHRNKRVDMLAKVRLRSRPIAADSVASGNPVGTGSGLLAPYRPIQQRFVLGVRRTGGHAGGAGQTKTHKL